MRRLNLLFLVLVLVACGAEQRASSPAEVLDRAAQNMEAAGSMRYALDATIESRELGGKPIPFTGEGVSSADGERGQVTYDLSDVFKAAAGASGAELFELMTDPSGWQAEERYIGEKGWVSIPALTELVGGEPWIEVSDIDGPDSGLDLALSGSPDNPAALLAYLRSLGPVDEVGSEQIQSRETTHYRATVELERVPDQAPADKREELRKKIERTIEQTGQRTVPFDIWVDGDALPRRMRFVDVTPPDKDEHYPTTWRATIDILEYGVPVRVTPPPAKDVMSERELDNLMEGGNV